MQVYLQTLQVKFVYQGHRVKVKVAGVKGVSVLFTRDLLSIESQSCIAATSDVIYNVM